MQRAAASAQQAVSANPSPRAAHTFHSCMSTDHSDMQAFIRQRWPIIVLAWAVPALLGTVETVMFWRMAGRDYPLWRAAAMQVPPWIVYALLTPVIFTLGTRIPLERSLLVRRFTLHLVFALLVGAAYVIVASAFNMAYSPYPSTRSFSQTAVMWYLSALPLTTITYFCILGTGAAIVHFGNARRGEVNAARLSAQLAEARLAALRMQLHPHFLFNTLNAITVLARDGENTTVVRMLTLLSDLLRDVLRADRGGEIPLHEELAFARRYLEIELVRFADRLTVREEIDESVRNASVPTFLLQPLLENALRHGVGPKANGGTVTVGARATADDLVLWVEDDGVGLSAPVIAAESYGVGLSNTAARLRELFDDRGTLVVAGENGATRATVTMPLAR